jgi:hypothetical protein
MFGSPKHAPIAEHEATGDIERTYHDIRQVLRVSGVDVTLGVWAGFERSFPLFWDAVRENACSHAFERAADELRAAGVRAALALPAARATADVPLGPSQLYHIGAALALYHYMYPKLLLLGASARLALDGIEVTGSPSADARKLPRGMPPRMYPLELVGEYADEPLLRQTFADMRQTLSMDDVAGVYRTLALWPDYLSAAWARLKPTMAAAECQAGVEALRAQAGALVLALPFRVKLSRLDIATTGEDDDAFIDAIRTSEQQLAQLMLAVALLTLDGASADLCMESPFPVEDAAAGGEGA